ncbi:hypothetical protein RSAG8_03634, partial [Rhizoctonia solani AG-8 WAC10335]
MRWLDGTAEIWMN